MARNIVIAIFLIACLFCKGFCTELGSFIQMYDRIYADSRFSERIVDLSNVSRIQCVSHCAKLPNCYYVSYNRQRSECDISDVVMCGDKQSSLSCFVKEDGWDIYLRDWECPDTLGDFSSVGSLNIALCHRRVVQQEAQRACTKFGHLLQIGQLTDFQHINNYLNSLPEDFSESVWVSGIYDDSTDTWKLPDGTSLTILPEMLGDADGSKRCLTMSKSGGFKYNDRHCNKGKRSYICQM